MATKKTGTKTPTKQPPKSVPKKSPKKAGGIGRYDKKGVTKPPKTNK